ncbi:PAS domain-containing sensor histidine kinase [Bosea sp. 685]|uniref:sensor histidine kinase n=1 Tax=Bosea sp. 685 TaxID=3080057 RepID=UPI002892F54C|nr:PAS domain-containing sensor histidine kinase [Bosea sp. 685]WNJ89209.1 PAS domain-containing sensor histidine kinase [Bosea sp. 685]
MTMSAIRTQVAALVHASVLPNSLERMRHERFILTRLMVGAVALGLAPAYLAWRGTLGTLEALIMIAAALPLIAVVTLSRSGRLDIAHCISASALALFIAALAGMTGGAGSPLLLWLAAVPTEAMFFGSRPYVARASVIAAIALGSVVILQQLGAFATPAPWTSGMMPTFVMIAILYAMVVAVGFLRRRDDELREHRASDARAQLLLDNVGDLVTWHDAGGSVLFANAAAKALAGADPQDLRGRGLFERVHIADRPLFLKALSDAAHGGGAATACFRTLFVPRSGDADARAPVSLWLEMRAHRIEDAGARDGVAVVCVMRDITARQALEEERARGHAEALKASDVKGQFLATVSHELRTPLNAIIGFSEMLSNDAQEWLDAEKRQEYAKIIHGSGHHLLDVVNTLLDISKIESGAMTIEQEPIDIAAVAQDCCALMALRAEASQVSLERVLGPDLPPVLGDRRALKQVMINLLSNAVKFTPVNGRVVLAVVRDGDMIDLSVADTGIGIAAADLPKLGDPFFQAGGSYDRNYEGTGLGLSVVRGLVGLHGGKLTIESAPGIGTRVAVRLPVGGVAASSLPVKITTFARAPRRGLESKEPVRLTA